MRRILGGVAAVLLAQGALADTYYFTSVSNSNASNAAAGESQLRMDVTDPGGSNVNFRFYWVGSTPMSICDVYFDDDGDNAGGGVLDAFVSLTGSDAGVAFSAPASPGNLPSGGNFDTSSGMSADSDAPVAGNGVNSDTEYLDILVSLLGSNTFTDVIAALNQGFVDTTNRGLRVGLHVQSIGTNGESESFVNDVNVVPLPPAAWAGLSCLGGALGYTRVRRRRINRD